MGQYSRRLFLFAILPVLAGCRLDTSITDLAVSNSYSVTQLTVTNPGIADGVTPVTITIRVKNKGVSAVNFVPAYSVTGSGNILGACSPTNAAGISTCQLRSTVAETKTISLLVPVSGMTASVTFNPYVPSVAGFAISSGGGVTTGPGMMSHSSIGLPLSPVILDAVATPGTPRARTGLHGILYEP